MSEYDNTNRGALFKNDKGDNPKRPDYTGTLDVDGVAHKLSGWIRKSQQGDTFLSVSIEAKEGDRPKPSPTRRAVELPDDPLPF